MSTQEEEIELNKQIIFSSAKDEYPQVEGILNIRNSGFSSLEINVVTINDYSPVSNAREYEKLSVYVKGGSKIEIDHEYVDFYPSFNANHKRVNLKQHYEDEEDIEYPEVWEQKWLTEFDEEERKSDPIFAEQQHELLEDIQNNKLDVDVAKSMLKDLLDNLIPGTSSNEYEYLFDDGTRLTTDVLTFIKDKLIDKIESVKVEDIKED